ncbi:sensor histidine kinase [Cellulomonas sp. ICMP 17802]|uniref:sensor histidine kinase n=1 Tax=Cellulomonas sp. ICMP 17802 TaxID=3239199 RepID=UPI00351AFDCC
MRGLLVRYGVAMAAVVLISFLVPLGLLSRSLTADRAIAAARQDAQSVAVFAGGPGQSDTRLAAAVLDVNDGDRRTTVFRPDGTIVGEHVAASPAVELAILGRALTARTDGGVEVLLPVGGTAGVAVVRTFVPDAMLTDGVLRSWAVLAGVGAALLAGAAVAGDRVAARLSRSVQDLASVADRLGTGDLEARVVPSGPAEVASVGVVLNSLGERVAGLLADEREAVADLSHRLRTPITALRLDVDLLGDPEERERMAAHVDDLVSAVDEAIATARRRGTSSPGRSDAGQVVEDRGRFWRVLAVDQGRTIRVQVPDVPAPVSLATDELGAALDVLVDNVFRHTPPRTGFTLSVNVVGGLVHIEVGDDGPGLPTGDLAQRGRSGAGSTGLGLDVARRTAERGGGRLMIRPAAGAGGASVTLELPEALAKP